MSQGLYQWLEDSSIHALVISDHAPVSITLSDTHPRGSDFIWRFPSYLTKTDRFNTLLKRWWVEFADTNSAHVGDPLLYWVMATVVLRGWLLAYSSSYKKITRASLDKAGARLRGYTKQIL